MSENAVGTGRDALASLGLTRDQCASLSSRVRSQVIGFLMHWEHYLCALGCLDDLLRTSPHLVSLYDSRARALLYLGHTEEALRAMEARHAIRDSMSSRVLLGRIMLGHGDIDRTVDLARQIVAENPDSILAWSLAAEANLAKGNTQAVTKICDHMRAIRPNARAYLLAMMDLHVALGDRVAADSYAVRIEEFASDEHPLPAYLLRRLRDHYAESHHMLRVAAMVRALVALHETELARAREAVQAELGRTPSTRPTGAAAPQHRPAQQTTGRRHPSSRQTAPTATAHTRPSPPVSETERARIAQEAQRHFGHDTLLPGQAETMAATLRGEDVLTILPTGGGKSLCYQLPAMLDESGLTLVISPLIALMKDQVDSLPDALASRATTLHSALATQELERRMNRLARGEYRLVYVAPERLRNPMFVHALQTAGVSRLVIDEAHCVSVWGHEFRPDYLGIGQAREDLGNPCVLAMTATAPPQIRDDVIKQISPDEASAAAMYVVTAPVDRPNLYMEAIRTRNADQKLGHLLAICQTTEGSGIVYAGTRQRSENVAAMLQQAGVSAGFYHAGIGDRRERAAAQDRFMNGDVRVMVATIAFGMGIDKADIRFIVHYAPSNSLEAYYQEAGRAGRDGLPSRCVLLHSSSDKSTLTRRNNQDALSVKDLRQVYGIIRRWLRGATTWRVALDDLRRDLGKGWSDTRVRLAISTLEQAGLIARHADAPRNTLLCLADHPANLGDVPEAFTTFVEAAHLRPRQSLAVDIIAVALSDGLDPVRIEWNIFEWADRGWITHHPAGRDALITLEPQANKATDRVSALLEDHASLQAQRAAEIMAYANTDICRHDHICMYLSGEHATAGERCDICFPEASSRNLDSSLPSEAEQLALILQSVFSSSWGPRNLSYILTAHDRASDAARRSPHWGVLAFRAESAISGMVTQLKIAGMVRDRRLDHGGSVIEITPKGRRACQNPSMLDELVDGKSSRAKRSSTRGRPAARQSKAVPPPVVLTAPAAMGPPEPEVPPLDPYTDDTLMPPPSDEYGDHSEHPVGFEYPAPAASRNRAPLPVPESQQQDTTAPDQALMEALVDWRLTRSSEAGVPAFVVAHNKLLERIATVCPRDANELNEIKGIGPKKLVEYGADILAIVRSHLADPTATAD